MAGYFKDLTGQIFGRLTVVEKLSDRAKGGYILWKCRCSCGNTHIVKSSHLTLGNCRSCGCLQAELNAQRSFKDLTGQRFGRWIVIERGPDKERVTGSKVTRKCKCDCGTVKNVAARYLMDNSKSCGCLQKELAKAQLKENNKDRVYEKGSDHKWWNPTLPQKLRDRQRPQSNETAQWRRQIFERDNYTCQRCGERGGEIAAHHKAPWLSSVELRFDLDNGITLCKECHVEYHAKHKGANANTETFNTFILSFIADKSIVIMNSPQGEMNNEL